MVKSNQLLVRVCDNSVILRLILLIYIKNYDSDSIGMNSECKDNTDIHFNVKQLVPK